MLASTIYLPATPISDIFFNFCLLLHLNRMEELGLSPQDKVICFGQLLGMCDQISFPLGTIKNQLLSYWNTVENMFLWNWGWNQSNNGDQKNNHYSLHAYACSLMAISQVNMRNGVVAQQKQIVDHTFLWLLIIPWHVIGFYIVFSLRPISPL